MLLTLALAHATPDRVAADLSDASGTQLASLAVDQDLELLALIDEGSSSVRVVDLQTWETAAVAVCDSAQGLATWTSDADLYIAVGCTTGDVDVVLVEERIAGVDSTQSLSADPILGLAVSDDVLWAVTDGEDLAIEGIATSDYALSDYTSTLARTGYEAMVGTTSYVFVVHGGDDVSSFQSTSGGTTASNENLGGRELVDAVPQLGNDVNLFLADGGGGLLRYQKSSDDFSILLDDEDGLADTRSLVIDPDGDWMALGEGATIQLREYSDGAVSEDTLADIDLDGAVATDLEAFPGYLFAATDAGELLVLTAYPWLEFDAAPGTLIDGDAFSLSFTSDTQGDWVMSLGGPTGTELASGSVDAGGTASADFEADGTWAEGTNRVWVTLGEGHDAVDVVVDNPPPQAVIDVGFGDSSVIVDITSPGITDLSHFEVYISETAFTADDYASGGPEDDALGSPIEVTTDDADADVSYTIEGLTNGVTYHVAVRVIDEAGTEGEMSEVYSVTPEETFGVAYLAGESSCSTTTRTGAVAGLALLGAVLVRRRRLAAGLALGAGLLVSMPAQAADMDGWKTKTRTNELHIGPMTLEDPQNTTSNEAWADTYGQTGLTYLRFDGGRQLYRVLEVNGGVGLLRKGGYLVSESGATSTEEGKITALPVHAGLTLRLDPTLKIKDEWRGMPVVPYAGAGLSYTLWREREGSIDTSDPFSNETYGGGVPGWYWHVGADILLDWMDPRRASVAQARWGIEDTYLTIEWANRTTIYPDGVEGLSFAGDSVTVGLKIDRK